MKKVIFKLGMALLLAGAFSFAACGNQQSSENAGESAETHSHADGDHDGHDHDHGTEGATAGTAHGEGKEYTSAYVCPMHCSGSGSEEPGKCPACGMTYIAQAEHVEDGHGH